MAVSAEALGQTGEDRLAEHYGELTRLIEPRPQAAPVMQYEPEPAEPVLAPAPFVVEPEPSPDHSAHPPGGVPAVALDADAAERIRSRLDRVMGLVAGAER